jgi:hypothetical protein
MCATPEETKAKLVTAIKTYIHMDNLVESFNQQATNARKLRAKHETDAIALMKEMGLTASEIHVSGARLRYIHKQTPVGLTWKYVRGEVTASLGSHKGDELMGRLQAHRPLKDEEYLEKITGDEPKVDGGVSR